MIKDEKIKHIFFTLIDINDKIVSSVLLKKCLRYYNAVFSLVSGESKHNWIRWNEKEYILNLNAVKLKVKAIHMHY